MPLLLLHAGTLLPGVVVSSADYTTENPVRGVKIITWLLRNGVTGVPFISAQFSDKSLMVTGTFGSGGTVKLEGSNDSNFASWFPLTDPLGNLVALSSAGIKQVLENPYAIRPHVTSGDGTTVLTIKLMCSTPTEWSNVV